MLNLEYLRRIDPSLKTLSDEDLERVRAKLYDIGQFAFEEWLKERNKPKVVPFYPVGLSHSLSGRCTI